MTSPPPAPDPDRPPHTDPLLIALVFTGGVGGALARYGLDEAVTTRPGGFPVATFVVNLTGALALGLLLAAVGSSSRWKFFLGTGFLGAYTTYSSLVVDTDRLGRHGHLPVALGYSVGSMLLGLALAAVGGRLLRGRRA